MLALQTMIALLLSGLVNSDDIPVHQTSVSCQTSDGSPRTEDVTAVINQVRGRPPGHRCLIRNFGGSRCTTTARHGTTAIGICGSRDSEESGLTWKQVASYANEIQQTCVSNGKVRGLYQVNADKKVIVMRNDW